MKMKSVITGVAPAILIAGMVFVSCQKNAGSKPAQNVSSNSTQNLTSFAASQSLINTADAQVFQMVMEPESAAKVDAGSCPPIVTYFPSADVFPHSVTIDYGTGCTSTGGLTRSGKITTVYTGDMSLVGSNAITTYDNYYLNGAKIEGTLKIAHNEETGTPRPKPVYRITQKDRKVIQANGDYIIYGGERRIIKKDTAVAYPGFPDGYFRVTGQITGDEMKGGVSYQWTVDIDPNNPLVYYFCDFIVKGIINVTFTNQDPWIVNYGTKTLQCDDQAELTINGVTTTVTLPLEF